MSDKLDDAFAQIVQEIIDTWDSTGEWRPSWNQLSVLPHNATSGRPYHGSNVLLLWAEQVRRGYSQPLWATYPQWQNAGGQVRRGEHGTRILFYTKADVESDTDENERRTRTVLRSFNVFNIDQVTGVLELEPIGEMPPGIAALTAVPARVLTGKPCYVPSTDTVFCPMPGDFDSIEDYAATLAHELGHWTGHPSRLDREQSGRWKHDAYAYEELVAELSAAFTCATLGIHSPGTRADHALYIRSWIAGLRDDPSVLMNAAAAAQLATNHLLSYAEAVTKAA